MQTFRVEFRFPKFKVRIFRSKLTSSKYALRESGWPSGQRESLLIKLVRVQARRTANI